MEIALDQAEDIAYELDAELRTDYSGRGMYGKECVGFSGDFDPTRLGVALASVLGVADAYDVTERVRQDSMGLGIIVYFPGVTIEPDEEEEDAA